MLSSYDLFEELVNKEKIFSNKIKERVRVNKIFNQINFSVNNNLKKFIKMSDSRYKSAKGGIKINDILKKQKGEYEELSNKILTNNLYKTNDIESESKKLFKKVGTKERKELYKIRKDIINNSKNLTQNEINLRKKYEDKIIKSKNKNKKELTEKEKEIIDLKNFIEKEKNSSLDDKKNSLINIIEKDSNFFDKNFETYKSFLKDIELQQSPKNLKITDRNDYLKYKYKYNFNIKNIKLLSYQKDVKKKVVKKKEEEKFDFQKLSQYTRKGNKKWFDKQLKEKSIQRKSAINFYVKNKIPILKYNSSKKHSIGNTKIDFNKTIKSSINGINNYYNKININNNTFYNSHNSTGFNKTIFRDFRNTIKTVRSEAELIRNISHNFDIKRKTMNKFFESSSLPSMEDYEKITLNNINRGKESNKDSLIISKFEDNKDDTLFEFNFLKNKESNDKATNDKGLNDKGSNDKDSNDKDSEDKETEKIMELYKTIFNDKVQRWTKEHKKKKQKKEMDKIRRINNQKFIERKKQLEEEQIIKGLDEHYLLMEKMVKNLNKENKINEEEDKINFNYSCSSTIHNNKTDNKNRSKEAYDEYLFFLDYLKKKNNKNEDDE